MVVIRTVKTKGIGKMISRGKNDFGHKRKQKYELVVAGVKSSSAPKATARKEKGSKMAFRDLEQQVNLQPCLSRSRPQK